MAEYLRREAHFPACGILAFTASSSARHLAASSGFFPRLHVNPLRAVRRRHAHVPAVDVAASQPLEHAQGPARAAGRDDLDAQQARRGMETMSARRHRTLERACGRALRFGGRTSRPAGWECRNL